MRAIILALALDTRVKGALWMIGSGGACWLFFLLPLALRTALGAIGAIIALIGMAVTLIEASGERKERRKEIAAFKVKEWAKNREVQLRWQSHDSSQL